MESINTEEPIVFGIYVSCRTVKGNKSWLPARLLLSKHGSFSGTDPLALAASPPLGSLTRLSEDDRTRQKDQRMTLFRYR